MRECKEVVERFADAFFGLDELVHAAFEGFDRGAGCDIVEKIAPDDRLRVFVRQTRFVLIGGFEVGPNALIRFYTLHVIGLPLLAAIFMSVHFWRIRRDGGLARPL